MQSELSGSTLVATHEPKPPQAPARLNYANKPKRSRRRMLLWGMIAGVAILAAAGWWWREPLTAHARLHVSQHQCANFEFAPDTLVASTHGPSAEFAAPLPMCWLDYQTTGGLINGTNFNRKNFSQTIVFLHRLRSPSGTNEKIVALNCYPLYLSSASVLQAFEPVVVTPADFWSLGARPNLFLQRFSGGYPVAQHVQIFGGKLDPNDSSRFTVDYTIDDTKGVIEGQLLDNGTVHLKIRPGSLDVMDLYHRDQKGR